MAKNNLPAANYAQPHKMKKVAVTSDEVSTDPNTKLASKVNTTTEAMELSIGTKMPVINPYGVGEMRGYGAATKGRKISGKMG